MQRFLSIFIFCFVFIVSSAQEDNLVFNRITNEDGLSASWVRSIYQDRYGFMWFGTSDGLNRYDGHGIKEYKPNEKDHEAIISGAVMYISEREDGKFWICTESGVNIYDRDNDVFLDFPLLDGVRVTKVLRDHENKIWFASFSGLFRYDPESDTMVNFVHDPNNNTSLSNNAVENMIEDSSDNLWIGTQDGLNRFNGDDQSFSRYYHSEIPSSIGGNFIQGIIEDKKGRIWVGNLQNGLDLFINAKDLPEQDDAVFEHILPGATSVLMIDSKNRLWIGHDLGFGVNVLDLNTFSVDGKYMVYSYNNIPYIDRSLSDDAIASFFEDRDGGIWIGTFAKGVSYTSSKMKKFHTVEQTPGNAETLSDNYVNFFLEEGENLWIATEYGVSKLNRKTNEYKNYYHEADNSNSLGANGVICIHKDSYNNIWFGTWSGGLNLYNRKDDNFIRFLPDENNEHSISGLNIFALTQDKNGTLWIGTNGGGLNSWDYTTKKFKHYLPDRDDPSSIYHNAINDICVTANGEMYISTYHSMDFFDSASGKFIHYTHDDLDSTSITDGNLLDIFEDSKHNLWIGTSRGLNFFDREKKNFTHYTTEDGLPDNTIEAILEDQHGNLWLSTNQGISKFVNGINLPSDPIFKNYTSDDGLQGNEFVRRSALKTESGFMYFGGSNGFTFFHPDSIVENTVVPEVVLIDFRLFGEDNDEEIKNVIHGKDVNLLDQIILNYKQSDFIIEYAALNYVNSKQNKYQFKLDGYEDDWHHVGSQRNATYTNIQHGKYTFMVRGSNNDGVWSEQSKELVIIIKPPWWNTLAFRLLVILMIIGLIFTFYKVRFAWLEKQKHILEKMVKERTTELSEVNVLLEKRQEEISLQKDELENHRNHLEKLVEKRTEELEEARRVAEASDKLKSAFLANMSHEIRTPMNAIVGFASMLREENIENDEKQEFIDIITSNSQTLLVLINDILEISLIEANQLVLSKDPFDAIKILEELESYFTMKNAKKLDIRFNNKEQRTELIFNNDVTRFRQVVSNLIGNSYKYTEEGRIEFGYKVLKNEVEFYVSDTGIGINEDEYQRIFDYFHKIDKGDNKLYRGAGIGLSICNKLVELMGGKIYLQSTVGRGSSFYFTMPFTDIDTSKETSSKRQDKTKYNLKGTTILIAEDEPTNYQLLARILKPTKAKILWAKNGLEALTMVKENKNHNRLIVLMDIKMPVMNGITANEEIQKLNKDIPVIAVTAYAQARDKEEILKHNFVDYIAKPLESKKLLEAINKQISVK